MKRIYYFGAGIALGVAATRRTRRAKEAAREALKAKVTPSAIAADIADAVAELGNAVGAFAADVRQGAINRRASYRPLIDSSTGAVMLVGPEAIGPAIPAPVEPRTPGAPPARPAPGRGSSRAESSHAESSGRRSRGNEPSRSARRSA